MNSCRQCKTNFTPKRDTKGLFCSYACYWESKKGQYPPHMIDRKLEPKVCRDCNKTLDRQAHYKNVRRCWGCYCVWIKAHGEICIRKPYGPTGPRLHMRGKNHPNWKGGITPINQIERARFRKILLMKVLERDAFTCQICDITGVYLHVDHIKSWSQYPELRFDMNNCRTLCAPCHYCVTFKKKMPKGIVWGQNLDKRVTLFP